MKLTRRNKALRFSETIAGTRFRMALMTRSQKHRWNNPRLYTRRKRQPVRHTVPSVVDCILDANPVKRCYRGWLCNMRGKDFVLRTRPKMTRFFTFRETFGLESGT